MPRLLRSAPVGVLRQRSPERPEGRHPLPLGARHCSPSVLLFALALLVAALLAAGPTASGQATGTPAAAGSNHAGLVVRDGEGRLTYAYVPFAESSISGIDLLRRGLDANGVPLVTIGFGGLGEGVCRIADQGCSAGECRRRVCQGAGADDPYWRYFRQAAPGDWRPLPLGASATEVRDGDVDAWSWTGADPGLPPLTLAEVARLADRSPASAPPPAAPAETGWTGYAGAAAILTAIAGGAFAASRRRGRRLAPERTRAT